VLSGEIAASEPAGDDANDNGARTAEREPAANRAPASDGAAAAGSAPAPEDDPAQI
jgi:hypothetical protein